MKLLKSPVLILLLTVLRMDAQEILRIESRAFGTYKEYRQDGSVISAGKVRRHLAHGTWRTYNQKGELTSATRYKRGVRQGPFMQYYVEGSSQKMIGTFRDGKKEGIWISYYPNDTVMKKESYVNGRRQGLQTDFYENGRAQAKQYYRNDTLASSVTFYPDGRIKERTSWKNDLKEGLVIRYPDEPVNDTFPQYILQYHQGEKHGYCRKFKSGVLIEEINYVSGKPHGTAKRWDLGHQLLAEENYSNGVKHGVSRYYSDAGVLLREERFNMGIQEGVQTKYDRGGLPLQRDWVTNDRLDSTITYYPGEKIFSRTIWMNRETSAVPVAVYTEYDTSGVLRISGNLFGGIRHGEWKGYYPNGAKRYTLYYELGVIKGTYTAWYPDGKIMIRYENRGDNTHTPPEIWDNRGRKLKPGTREYEDVELSNLPGNSTVDPSRFQKSVHERRVEYILDEDDNEGEYEMEYSHDDLKAVPDTEIVAFPEVMPQFPGGSSAMMNFVAANLRYPEEAREMGLEGRVFIEFIVEKDGSISRIKAVKEVSGAPMLTEEAIRVVRLFPAFQPATLNNQPIRSRMVVPINFVLR